MRSKVRWHERRHQLPLELAFEHREFVILDPADVHLRMHRAAHPGRANDGPGGAAKLREEVRSLDALQNKPGASVHGDTLARLGNGNAASMRKFQSAHFGVQARRVESRDGAGARILPSSQANISASRPSAIFSSPPSLTISVAGIIFLQDQQECDQDHTRNFMTTIDYDAWAQKYDDTRGASPSVAARAARQRSARRGPHAARYRRRHRQLRAGPARSQASASCCAISLRRWRAGVGEARRGSPFVVADGQHLPFRDASFDCAISVKVLSHVPDWRLCLREARRVVRDGPFVLCRRRRERRWKRTGSSITCRSLPTPGRDPLSAEADIIDALRDAGFGRMHTSSHVHTPRWWTARSQALKHYPEVFLVRTS